jgi:hypothetical protein
LEYTHVPINAVLEKLYLQVEHTQYSSPVLIGLYVMGQSVFLSPSNILLTRFHTIVDVVMGLDENGHNVGCACGMLDVDISIDACALKASPAIPLIILKILKYSE